MLFSSAGSTLLFLRSLIHADVQAEQFGTSEPIAENTDDVTLIQQKQVVQSRSIRLSVEASWREKTSWHPMGDWGFTAKFPQESTIKEFEAWDAEHGWASPVRPGLNLSDQTQWPPITPCASGWKLGLSNPQIAVISMEKRLARRVQFKNALDSLCIKEKVEWAPAMDGRKMPPATIWLRGPDQTTWSHEGDQGKPGAWGCFVTHFAILRQFHERCPECDAVVFEDDVVFSPDFGNRWTRFLKSLPEDWDIIRLGSQSLWAPPLEVDRLHLKVTEVANTWGYILRAKRVKEVIDTLATIPADGLWGIDAMFNVFAGRMNSYAPNVPLIYGNSFCHDTEPVPPTTGLLEVDADYNNCETVTGLQQASQKLVNQWPLGYYRTYCKDHGQPFEERRQSPGCKSGLTAMSCCPYQGMQNPPPTGKVAPL
mmetsp:Transcript_25162/g.45847  ORF Transcript_25162/g.45847 Transcript_25162/m.45847 type:complete len:425 (+) Transcript_25162:70-1344(+)